MGLTKEALANQVIWAIFVGLRKFDATVQDPRNQFHLGKLRFVKPLGFLL
jgi:hypothetical protein